MFTLSLGYPADLRQIPVGCVRHRSASVCLRVFADRVEDIHDLLYQYVLHHWSTDQRWCSEGILDMDVFVVIQNPACNPMGVASLLDPIDLLRS